VAGSIRDRLTTAAAHLKNLGDAEAAEAERLHQDEEAASAHRDRADEAYDAAAAVESILAPRGYLLLRRQEQTAPASPLTVTLNEDLKRTLLAAGEEFGVVFSGLAEEAYRLVRDSEWLPPKPTKAARGTGGKKAVLNVRVDAVLRQEVQELLPALAERVGYRITEGSIVLAHICEELGIERPGAEEAEWLRMVMPAPLVDYLRERVEAERLTFQKVLEDGLRDMADGADVVPLNQWITDVESRPRDGGRWVPVVPEAPLSGFERAKLDLKLHPDLLDRIRHRAGIESSRHGVLVHPGAIARAILTSRLGEPEEVAQDF